MDQIVALVMNEHLRGHGPELTVWKDLRERARLGRRAVRLIGDGAMGVAVADSHIEIAEEIDAPVQDVIVKRGELERCSACPNRHQAEIERLALAETVIDRIRRRRMILRQDLARLEEHGLGEGRGRRDMLRRRGRGHGEIGAERRNELGLELVALRP
ncbi:hypothetical protein IVB33_23375 [Bradyrhizobium sp. 24]|nr:hypothetical protein [Bradyrhizobium sp. 24]